MDVIKALNEVKNLHKDQTLLLSCSEGSACAGNTHLSLRQCNKHPSHKEPFLRWSTAKYGETRNSEGERERERERERDREGERDSEMDRWIEREREREERDRR